MPSINIVAVIVVAVISMVTGSLWYSPMMFQKMWVKLSGREMPSGSSANMAYALSALTAIIRALVLAIVLGLMGTTGVVNAVGLTFILWLGFVLPPLWSKILYGQQSYMLLAIDAGYYLIDGAIGAIILTMWR